MGILYNNLTYAVFIVCVVARIMCLTNLIFQELFQLEEDVKLLEEMYPQGEKVVIQISNFLTSWHIVIV